MNSHVDYVCVLMLSAFQRDPDASLWSQYQFAHWPEFLPLLTCHYVKVAQNRSENNLFLHYSKTLTDAVAKAGREWNEGIRMSTDAVLWQETLRTELFRVREVARVTVKGISYDDDICSFRNFIAIDLCILTDGSGKKWNRREETQRLLYHTLQITQFL